MENTHQLALFQQVIQRIAQSRNILLASPVKPDADSCASMFAFYKFFNRPNVVNLMNAKNTDFYLWAPEKPEPNTMFARIRSIGDPTSDIKMKFPDTTPDLIVAFDYGQFRRLRLDLLVDETLFIGFDHHPNKTGSGFPVNGIEICDPTASSTTTLLYRFFKYINPTGDALTPEIAECLLVGLMADTSKLTNKLTNLEALETAAALSKAGADYHGVLESMRMEISLAAFNAQMKARDRVIIDQESGLGFIAFSQEDLRNWGSVTEKDILSLHGFIQNIEGIQVAAAYYERPDGTWYCSLRNRSGKGVKVGEIARRLAKGDGGGHDYAAGFTSDKPPEEVFKNIKQLIVV